MNVTLAGVRATSAEIRVPQMGIWVADVDFDTAVEVSAGKVALAIGTATFVGTVDPRFSGTFAGRRRMRVVGGANGWARELPSRHYHNDAGVRDRTVIQGAADECGEVLNMSTSTVIGADYVRGTGRAATTLTRLAPAGWYVDYAGVTQVGPRVVAKPGKFDVLDFDSRQNLVTIGTSEAQSVGIGAVISDRLDKPLTVRDLTIRVSDDGARVLAWGTT